MDDSILILSNIGWFLSSHYGTCDMHVHVATCGIVTSKQQAVHVYMILMLYKYNHVLFTTLHSMCMHATCYALELELVTVFKFTSEASIAIARGVDGIPGGMDGKG